MDLTHGDVKKILEIVDSAEHLDELELVYGSLRLRIHRGAAPMPAATYEPAPVTTRPSAKVLPESGARHSVTPEQALNPEDTPIRAPMLGTFYRSPAPGERPFVEVGQRVKIDDTVCLIEVMKLFSSIKAGVDGVVKQIFPPDGKVVELNEVLIVVTPQDKASQHDT